MTDVFDRIRAANPVGDPDRYYESVVGDGDQLLAAISDRRDHMTVEEITRLETPPPPPAPPSFDRWKVALGAAAAVVAVVAGVALVTGGGDDVAGATDVEIAEEFVALFESGDVAGYEALVAPDAEMGGGPFFGIPSSIWAYFSGFQAAMEGTYTTECTTTPTSPTVDVICKTSDSNIFREATGLNPHRYDWTFAIDDGTITLLSGGGR